jgi:hypothetical protein
MYFFLIGEMKLKKKIEKNNINYSNTDLETYVERLTVFIINIMIKKTFLLKKLKFIRLKFIR